MNILQICNKSPWPPKEGGPIAMNSITQGLIKAGHSVKVLAIFTPKFFTDVHAIPATYKHSTRFESVYIDTGINPLKAVKATLAGNSYHVERFISQKFDEVLTAILKKETFDVIQLETLYVATYINTIRKYSSAKIVLRAHNIEHLIWQRITDTCANPFKRFALRQLTANLRRFELNMMNRYDGIAAITQFDADYIGSHGCNIPLTSIPFGIETDDYVPGKEVEEFSLFHIGSMDWIPNQEGIRWFLEEAWGKIHHTHPELRLHLAGRNMPDWLRLSSYPNVVIEGEVEDATAFMNKYRIMVVPLLSGSGIRVKIIEGMALQKTIITTSIGAEGINCKDKENILIADTPDAFNTAASYCASNPFACNEIAANARAFIIREHNNNTLIGKLTDFYKSL